MSKYIDGERSDAVSKQIDLKPCPFCGGTAEVKVRYRNGIPNRKMYWVSCKKCQVSQAHDNLHGYNTKEKAIRVWNWRAKDE